MQSFMVSLVGLVLSVSVGAEPLLKGRVWLASGPPAAGVQVRLFDLTDLRRSVGTITDEAGHFALRLQTFSTDRRPALPQDFALGQNYPNPFNPSTIIPYQIPTTTHVRLEVFNLLGQRLATLVDGDRPAGAHTAQWDATDAAGRAVGAGVFIYRLTGGGHTVSRRMVLIDGQAGIPAGAAGPRQTAAVGVQTAGSVYGLTVAGTGLIAYVNPAFRVGTDRVDLVLEQPGGQARMKVATGGILGDVNNDGQVDEFDVLYVALYSKDPSITLPNHGDISLGDVNGDGTVDLADGLLLALYKVNPSDPTLPPGIGQPVDGSGDDHGDTPSSATALAVGSSRLGQLETGGDVDYFRVAVAESGALTVHTTGSLDTKGQLEDSAGGVLARDDDGGDGYNFRLAHTVSAGTYYIKVEGYDATTTGRYTIHASGPGGGDGPDLIVASASVSDNTLTPGQSFTLNATVRNQGTAAAAATTVHYYQSPDATITADDAPVGTDPVSGLSADHTSAVSIDLTAPSSAGTYYYGACVASVSGESNTDNNCSPGVQVTVRSGDGIVNIADANLRAVIAEALDKAPNAPITPDEMATLTELDAYNKGIRNLTGLEFATNLRELSLVDNNITDVSPLSGLTNLADLWLTVNNITDVSPLESLTRLELLSLSINSIADLSPLSGLTNLTWLGLAGNNIADVSLLSGLTNLTLLDLAINNIADVSPLSGLTNLTWLELHSNRVADVSPLSGLTNLRQLGLHGNRVADVSPLSGLTNLRELRLQANNIADVSPLSGLTNLTRLLLHGNSITDVSLSGLTNLRTLSLYGNSITDVSLSGLTRLEDLRLQANNIADVSPLSGLTNLIELDLESNIITDVSPLVRLTNLIELDLRGNPLSVASINVHIAALVSRGTSVFFESFRQGDFDIELVYLDPFTEFQKRVVEYAARRWMSILPEDLPDIEFARSVSGGCFDHSFNISRGERIDDLRIYVTHLPNYLLDNIAGIAGPRLVREASGLTVVGCVGLSLAPRFSRYFRELTLHEMGHVFGVGTLWDDFGFLQARDGDTHFNGPLATAAFNSAGGRNYPGPKVPAQREVGGHWRRSVFQTEFMVPSLTGRGWLSAITVQSLADLGYSVDVAQADPYTLPSAAQASTEIASIDSWDDHLIGHLGLSPHAEPELSCGVGSGEARESIYVVNEQGAIIRTLGD